MKQAISDICSSQHLAVVGVSEKKMSGAIYKDLKKHGFHVYAVNPKHETFLGDKCYPNLKALRAEVPEVTSAVLALKPEVAEQIVEDAAASGITHLWFQRGADFVDAFELAEKRGIKTVHDKCILMYAQPVTGVHAVHRFFAKVFGKL